MSAQSANELVAVQELPAVPDNWNFDESVAHVRPVDYKWKNLTREMLTELYIAREVLSHRGLPPNGRHTWDEYCEAIGMSQSQVNRWLQQFNANASNPLMTSTTPEWLTPSDIIDRAATVLGGIDLDPCSDNHGSPNVPAVRHYTQDDDGLNQQWVGRVYMNPPYGRAIGSWVGKLDNHHRAGDVSEAIALVPARTDTAWFRILADYPVCFLAGRLRFSDSLTGAPFPSGVFYLGPRLEAFAQRFEDIGDIYIRYRGS